MPLAGEERRGTAGGLGGAVEADDPRHRLDADVVVEPQQPAHDPHAALEGGTAEPLQFRLHHGRIAGRRGRDRVHEPAGPQRHLEVVLVSAAVSRASAESGPSASSRAAAVSRTA